MTATPVASGLLRILLQDADRRTRLTLLVAALLAVTASVLTALAPIALKELVDTLNGPGHPDRTGLPGTLLLPAVVYLAALGLGRLLTEVRPWLIGTAEQRLNARLGQRFFRHLLGLPMGFHLGRQTGELTQSFNQATSSTQFLIVNLLLVVPITIELLTVLAVLIHLRQPALAAIFVASAFAYAFVYAVGTRRIKACGRAVSAAGLQLHAVLAESLLNVETIKCYGLVETFNQRFGAGASALKARWSAMYRHRAGMGVSVATVFVVSMAASLWAALQAVDRGALTIGGFVMTTVYMLQMVRPLETIGAAVRDVSQATEFIKPMLEILHSPVEAAGVPDDQPATSSSRRTQSADGVAAAPPALAFSDVHLSYAAAKPALRGLTLEIPAGKTIAVVGPSGSGKSTMARLLLRLMDPDSGRILWNRRPGPGPTEARAAISFVSQELVLFNDTIEANILVGRPDATHAEVETVARAACLHELVTSLPEGYGTPVGERGLRMSGGERQRIALARAFLRRAQLHVLDEPTSMLDSSTEAQVLERLREACGKSTTVLITHRLAAARHADLIAVVTHGRVSEYGTHAGLLAAGGAYTQMWHTQAKAMDGAATTPA